MVNWLVGPVPIVTPCFSKIGGGGNKKQSWEYSPVVLTIFPNRIPENKLKKKESLTIDDVIEASIDCE